MSIKDLGRYGEEFVARHFGFRRQPASGARWPYKEDLLFAPRRQNDEGLSHKALAQVKTTRSRSRVKALEDLIVHAEVIDAEPMWYDVVVTPGKVYVIEGFVHVFDITVGGDDR